MGGSFLRPDVCVRPQVNHWPANEQLVPPLQYALNAKHKHLELLSSYLDSPAAHHDAAHSDRLKGGPWVDIPPGRSVEVEGLVAGLHAHPWVLPLADAIGELDRLLDSATGGPMAPLYDRIPALLRGFTELVYDYRDRPAPRFIEPLLYCSEVYDPGLQSVGLEVVVGDERAFQDTTPLLPDDRRLDLAQPFDHPGFDALFAARRTPRPFDELCELLGVAARDRGRFAALFSEAPPCPASRFAGPGVRVRYFGHACVLFETRDVVVLTDPVISYRHAGLGPARFTHADLPDAIDYVVLTHFHKDHLDIETLLQLRPFVRNIVIPKTLGGALHDPSFKLALRALGFRCVVELDTLESIELPGGSITALPFLGEHADLDVRARAAHLVRLEGNAILCAADSDNIEPALYRRLQGEIGDVDLLFLGMECVGAPMSVTYRGYQLRPLARKHDLARRTTGSDFAKARQLVETFHVKQVHVYAMGLEPWLGHILPVMGDGRDARAVTESARLLAHCRERGMIAERPFCKAEIELARQS